MKDYGMPLIRPFQCFMGQWEGLCKTFDVAGGFLESSAVHIDAYWIGEDVWHFHEHCENLYGYGEAFFDLEIRVTGKTCFGEDSTIKIAGTELTADNYVFTIESSLSKTTVLNSHYFLNPYQRRIITHKLRDGKTQIFQIQDFTRVC